VSAPIATDRLAGKHNRVMLVEDNDAASRGLAKILIAFGYEVTIRFDGTSALETLKAGEHPDFLLTDLRLPDLDGREVARFASQLIPRPWVALITGWDLDPDVRDYASWGIDWVFPKPLNVHELIAKLREPFDQDSAPRGESDDGTSMTT
jgi:DNA-binding response OmpR family regulator